MDTPVDPKAEKLQTLLNEFTQMAADFGVGYFEIRKLESRQEDILQKMDLHAAKLNKLNGKVREMQVEAAKNHAKDTLKQEEAPDEITL